MQRSASLWSIVLSVAWFGIGGTHLVYHSLPQMVSEWRTFANVGSDLKKRDILFPGWAECVQVVQRYISSGADVAFLSDADDEKYSYFSYLLNYEVYPLRHLRRSAYAQGLRPRFVLIYPHPPAGLRLDQYRKVYGSARVQLLERIN